MLVFDEQKLVQALNVLSLKQGVAFAASCCERLLPNYEAFTLMEKWGDYKLLSQNLSDIWESLQNGMDIISDVAERVSAIKSKIPHSERFASPYTGLAQNAGAAVIYALQGNAIGDTSKLATVGRLSVVSIDAYLHALAHPYLAVIEMDAASVQSGQGRTSERAIDESSKLQLRFEEWVETSPLMQAELGKQQTEIEGIRSSGKLDREFLIVLRRTASHGGIQPIARGLVKQ